ncbi:MAG: alpha/beta hydrolase, partial [Rhodocyclaceae bacterium]|nr:alpha/beta hydrolase [Rhodocyclaceae bacterium]
PALYRAGEAHAYWRQVCAPTLWIVQEDAQWRRTMLKLDDAQYRAATECFRDFEEVRLPACGHNMHHSRPEAVAQAMVQFLARTGAARHAP